jgi:hypothetical protein
MPINGCASCRLAMAIPPAAAAANDASAKTILADSGKLHVRRVKNSCRGDHANFDIRRGLTTSKVLEAWCRPALQIRLHQVHRLRGLLRAVSVSRHRDDSGAGLIDLSRRRKK